MKRITSLIAKSLVAILIGGGALAGNLQAQSDSGITVSIPFPFTVGTQCIAPGTYRFSLVSDQFLLSVLNVKTGSEEMFRVQPEHQRALESHGHLIFRESEGYRALNEVHFPSADTFSEVIERRSAGRLEAKKTSTSNSISVGQR
ncbi:MAG: hypothetical protein WB524_01480 [Acidobacteriaceae bacterium]|jgi:hypothetical protein